MNFVARFAVDLLISLVQPIPVIMKFIIAELLINSHQHDNPNGKPDNQPADVDGRMQSVAENISPGDFEVIKKHCKKLSRYDIGLIAPMEMPVCTRFQINLVHYLHRSKVYGFDTFTVHKQEYVVI